jgi:ribosomal protein S18 acetylase RimI-like enzyme
MDITIRKPDIDEWQKYKELRLQSLKEYPSAFSSSYEESVSKPDEDWRKTLEASIKFEESGILCAYDGENMIGCVGAYWKNKSKTKHVANVGLMYVKPQYHGQKLGEKLLVELLSILRSMGQFRKVKLEVVTNNLPAFNLYKKLGFLESGVNREELFIDGVYFDTTAMELPFELT